MLGERTNLCDKIQCGDLVKDGSKIGGDGGDKIGIFGGLGKLGGDGDGSRSGRRLRGGGTRVKHRAVSEPRPPSSSSTKESNETGEPLLITSLLFLSPLTPM